MKSAEEDGDTYSETMDKPLVSLATKDTTSSEVVSGHLNAEDIYIYIYIYIYMRAVITNVKE